jgi:hypothetical protein
MSKHDSDNLDLDAGASCEAIREAVIDLGWSGDRRREMTAQLGHIERCEVCRTAMRELDEIRAVLAGDERAGDERALEPAGGWSDFQDRLRTSVEQHHRKRHGAAWFKAFGAIAAALILAATGFWLGRQPTGSKQTAIGGALATGGLLPISAADVARQVCAFGEVNQVFEGQTRWLLLTNAGADVGLDESSASTRISTGTFRPGVAKERVLVLRLNVSRGAELVSTADLVIVPGKTAELHVPTRDGSIVRYRVVTSSHDPSKLALRAELNGAGGETQAAIGTDIHMREDGGTSAGELIAPSGRYDVKVAYAAASI